jgi:hypothetical protein
VRRRRHVGQPRDGRRADRIDPASPSFQPKVDPFQTARSVEHVVAMRD